MVGWNRRKLSILLALKLLISSAASTLKRRKQNLTNLQYVYGYLPITYV